MTRLYGALLLLLFTLVAAGCARSASSEELAQASPVALQATESTGEEGPSAMPDITRTYTWEIPPAYPLDGPATPTATITAKPHTAMPLPLDLPAGCPVTRPPDPPFDPPGRPVEVFKGKFWYGSDDLYLALPINGTWAQLARGEKVFWWSVNYPGAREEEWRPEMTIRARRLDEPGQTLEQSGATNASHASFPRTAMLHGLTLPTPGCWEITGAYKGAELSFVVWVP